MTDDELGLDERIDLARQLGALPTERGIRVGRTSGAIRAHELEQQFPARVALLPSELSKIHWQALLMFPDAVIASRWKASWNRSDVMRRALCATSAARNRRRLM